MAEVPREISQREWKALQTSFKREKRGRDWYRKAAAAAGNPIAKATFDTLASRQERYLGTIQRVCGTLQREPTPLGRRVRFPTFRPARAVVEDILQKAGYVRCNEIGIPGRGVFRAYLLALGFEEKGVEMYAGMAHRANGEIVEGLFDFLRKRKGEHYLILDETLTCMHHSESFVDGVAESPLSHEGG